MLIVKFLVIFFLIFFCLSKQLYAADEGCSDVYSFLVFEEKSGKILSKKRSESFFHPASLVKLMTLYLTFEALKKNQIHFDQVLTISELGEEISKVNKINSLHLKAGDKITVREAIFAVIVKSFNEAATSLAEVVADNEWNFVRKMNKKAAKIGMINSSFRNSTGLHEEGQYTNSYDLARLVKAIKSDFPEYYHFFAAKDFIYRGQKYETHNHVLVDYNGAEGLKTGFTKASGFNLISAARKNNKRVVSILLGCVSYEKRDSFTKELLDEAFKKLSKHDDLEIAVKLTEKFDYMAKKHEEKTERHFGMNILELEK